MRLEVIHVIVSFLDCLHQFDPIKVHIMLTLMFNPKFKDLFILNNYVGTEKSHNCSNKVWFWNVNSPFVLSLSKSSSFCKTSIKFWPPRMTIGNVWCNIDSRSNCHGTCKFLVFVIICKFLIFVIHFHKTYLSQMCNANNLFLTIDLQWKFARFRNLQFVAKSYIEDPLNWCKAHETQFPIVTYLVR